MDPEKLAEAELSIEQLKAVFMGFSDAEREKAHTVLQEAMATLERHWKALAFAEKILEMVVAVERARRMAAQN